MSWSESGANVVDGYFPEGLWGVFIQMVDFDGIEQTTGDLFLVLRHDRGKGPC